MLISMDPWIVKNRIDIEEYEKEIIKYIVLITVSGIIYLLLYLWVSHVIKNYKEICFMEL